MLLLETINFLMGKLINDKREILIDWLYYFLFALCTLQVKESCARMGRWLVARKISGRSFRSSLTPRR